MEDKDSNKRKLPIPARLTDVTSDWVSDLLYSVLGAQRPVKTEGTHNGLTLLQIRARAGTGFRQSCHVRARCGEDPKIYSLIVEIVPDDPEIRELVARHNLFLKEILVHEKLLPLLKNYVEKRSLAIGEVSGGEKTLEVAFSVPNYVYGDYDQSNGCGVMIFEDFTEEGFEVEDPHLMLLHDRHVTEVIRNLSTFHAICVAFQTTEEVKLEQMFPLLDTEKGAFAWQQDDMGQYLSEMYSTCKNFLKAIPGQEDLSHWFERKMSDPGLLLKVGQAFKTKLKTVIHGDLWHNNIFFKDNSKGTSLMVTDWQMCHIGNATNDLCFLIFSSTTPTYRKHHWESSLQLYYDVFTATIRSLGLTERQLTIGYDEFLASVKTSVPVSLFFCGNVQDFELHSEAALARVNTIDYDDESGEDEDEEAWRRLQGCFSHIEQSQQEISPPMFANMSYSSEDELDRTSEPIGDSNRKTFIVGGQRFDDHDDSRLEPPSSETRSTSPKLFAMAHRGLAKVPTIASDSDLASLERMKKDRRKVSLDPRKARAMRRKLYLDLYRDAVNKGFI